MSQSDLARLLGTEQPQVSLYENGKARPSLVTAARIERLAGIPASAWVDEAELADVPDMTSPSAA